MSSDADFAHWHHAVNTRDARFNGVFVVALTSTRVYCLPSCPSRLARPEHRRFFTSSVDADVAGYRPCRRCRPDALSETPLDAVPRTGQQVMEQIAAGALDRQSIGELASSMGLSERHLRRALERRMGVTPTRLALTLRLQRATELLRDPRHTVSRVAYDSGFRSVRRFNAAFRAQFGMSPTAWRRGEAAGV